MKMIKYIVFQKIKNTNDNGLLGLVVNRTQTIC
jgi:hypothetical protein